MRATNCGMHPTMDPQDITGLVLAGGQGSRMGGIDKGLEPFHGIPLALHALRRLQPQVGSILVNANRHLDIYRTFGAPVCPDAQTDFSGPLAGFLAGMEHCHTPWLLTVPCDTPLFPPDLAQRLAEAASIHGAAMAMAMALDRSNPLQPAARLGCLARLLARAFRPVFRHARGILQCQHPGGAASTGNHGKATTGLTKNSLHRPPEKRCKL